MIAAAASAGPGAATIITGIVLAVAAITSSVTPIILARRRSAKEAQAEAKAKLDSVRSESDHRADLTLASWTALNGALQQEIIRLQGVTDRQQQIIDRCQARVEVLETEQDTLQAKIRELTGPHA